MTPTVQTFIALAITAIAVVALGLRALAKRRNPGCGGECGCPSSELKRKLPH